MIMRIAEVGGIGEHDGGKPLFPEGGMVAASGIRELFAVARYDQWNDREVRLHGLGNCAGQSTRLFVADHGQKISSCGHGDGHTGRDLLRVWSMTRIADAFQHDCSMNRFTILSQKRCIGGAAEQVLFFQVEAYETNRSGQFHGSDLASDLEHHREGAGVIIGAGRPLHSIEVRGDDQRGCGTVALGVGNRGSNQIMVSAAQRLERLPRDGQACFRELSVEIGFCFLEANRRREWMTLAYEAMQVVVELIVINGHVVRPHAEKLIHNFGPDALAGEDFEKNGMGNTPVNNVGFPDPLAQGVQARMDFRNHPLRDGPFFHHALHIFA